MNSHGGRVVKRTGDGMLAVFDLPSEAIAAAHRLEQRLAGDGMTIRCGLHIGEVDVDSEGDLHGLAVHVAARVTAVCRPGEVLVTSTVASAITGATVRFEPRGTHHLEGVPGEWVLTAVEPDPLG